MTRLIDGDALIAWIKGSQQMTSKMKNIICYIKTMPNIEARPKGEWIKHEAKSEIAGLGIDFYPTEYECSCCGLKEQMYFINSKPHNYCPNCGADMRKREGE